MKAKLTAALIVLLVIGVFVSIALDSKLAVYLSVLTIGLALALQKYVASFFGYFVITASKMLQVGDRIRITNIKGDVRHIGLFHLVLDEVGEDEKLGGELTGRIMHVPNLVVLDQPVLNYSKGFIRVGSVGSKSTPCEYVFDEIRIPVSVLSNVRRAAKLLEEIIQTEDEPYIRDARIAFKNRYPTFLQEADAAKRTLVHIEAGKVWIKGKFVAPFRARNELRSRIYLKFLEHTGKDSDINLA